MLLIGRKMRRCWFGGWRDAAGLELNTVKISRCWSGGRKGAADWEEDEALLVGRMTRGCWCLELNIAKISRCWSGGR